MARSLPDSDWDLVCLEGPFEAALERIGSMKGADWRPGLIAATLSVARSAANGQTSRLAALRKAHAIAALGAALAELSRAAAQLVQVRPAPATAPRARPARPSSTPKNSLDKPPQGPPASKRAARRRLTRARRRRLRTPSNLTHGWQISSRRVTPPRAPPPPRRRAPCTGGCAGPRPSRLEREDVSG
jgi:hypothetical protein